MSKLLTNKKLCQLYPVLWDVYCYSLRMYLQRFGCRCILEQHKLYWCVYRAFCRILVYLPNTCTIYINNICFLKHSYLFWCLYIILRQSLLIYAKVTKLLKWQLLYKLLLQIISRLKSLKHCNVCQIVYNSFTVHRTLLCGWWLYIQSTETGIVFLVGSVLHRIVLYCSKSVKWRYRTVLGDDRLTVSVERPVWRFEGNWAASGDSDRYCQYNVHLLEKCNKTTKCTHLVCEMA